LKNPITWHGQRWYGSGAPTAIIIGGSARARNVSMRKKWAGGNQKGRGSAAPFCH
jgi:hypothetical protein